MGYSPTSFSREGTSPTRTSAGGDQFDGSALVGFFVTNLSVSVLRSRR